jgi:hypothetical protein
MQPNATHVVDRRYRLRGRLLFGFGLLGWFAWGPTLMAAAPLPLALKPLMLPAGFLVGLLVGDGVAAFIEPMLSERVTDDDPE